METALHQFFARARVEVRFENDGLVVSEANEWFSVPLAAIDEAVDLIDGEAISGYEYGPSSRAIRLQVN